MWNKLNITLIILVHSAAIAGQNSNIPPAITLKGHQYKVNHICYNKSGELMASCGWDNTVIIWDMNTCTVKYVMQGHTDNVWTVKFSPDEKYLISGGMDATMIICDFQSGNTFKKITAEPEQVNKIGKYPEIKYFLPNSLSPKVFNKEGTLLYAGSTDGLIRILDLNSLEFTDTLYGHKGATSNMAISGDGSLLATGSWENELFIWDLESQEIIHSLKAKEHSAYSLKFINNDTCLFGAGGTSINIWDIESETIVKRYTGQRGMTQCGFSPDGRYLASCAEDHTVWLRDYKTGDILWKYRGPKMEISTMAFSPDGKYLAIGTPESDILIWKMDEIIRQE